MATSIPSARQGDGLIAGRESGRNATASPTRPSLLLNRHIKAPPDRVFAAWTDPARITQWFIPGNCNECRAEVDVRVGGRFHMVIHEVSGETHDVSGMYRVVAPPTLLVFTWAWRSAPERESLVTLRLRPDGDGTMLTLLHEFLSDEAVRDEHEKGWSVALDKLQDRFASILTNKNDTGGYHE